MVVRWNAAAPAPIANSVETVRDVPRSPILNAPIRWGDEPDMLAMGVGYREPVKVTEGPCCSTESIDATSTDDQRVNADLKTIRVSCFRWDKPGGWCCPSCAGKGRG